MTDRPSYEELEKRVAALEAQHRRDSELKDALEQNLSFTESLLASVPTPVFWKDASGRYLGCNAAFTEFMGVTSEQIRGKTVQDLWPGEQARIHHRKDLELLENPQRQAYEFEVKDQQGRIRSVVYHKRIFRAGNGEVAGIVGCFADINDIRNAKEAHEALRSQRNLLNSLFDNLPIGITIWDSDGRLIMANKGFTGITGYTEDDITDVDIWFTRAYPDPAYRRIVVDDWRAAQSSNNASRDFKVVCRDGTVKEIEFNATFLKDGRALATLADITDRRRAMAEREASHRLLQSVLDAVPDLLVVVNRDLRIRYSNNKGHDLVQPLEGTLSQTCYGRFKQRDTPCKDCSAESVFADGKGIEREMTNPADGRIREVRAFPIFDADGRVSSVVEHVRDITEIRQAQEEIHQRRQFLESVLYHAPDAIITLDDRHRVIDWNPGAVKMFGYTPAETIGHQLDDLVARRQHHAEASGKTAQVLSGQRVEAFETIRYRKDGTPIHVIAAGSPIMIEGELKGVVAVYTDITDRVRNEETLRTSHNRFLTVLDSIDATIYVADMESYEILFMNKNMIQTFGSDLTGMACWKAFRKAPAPCPDCTNDRLVDENGRPAGVVVWQGQNPMTGKWYINYDRAIEWIDGRIVRIQIAMDITEHKKLEDAFQKAQRMEAIGTLASGIAHDFNNLLQGIQGRTSLIAVDLPPGHPHKRHTAAIEEHIRSAVNLTKQLLGIVRGGKYEVTPVDISALVKTSAALFGRTRKQIRISTKTAPEPLVVEADKRQIEQALLNIYVNAWQAMPGGGDLYIETSSVELDDDTCTPDQIPPGRYVKITLTDSGIGMSEDVRQKVFDPFFTTKPKGRGTGLGLASAYGIVRNHGGVITVYSELGRGSTFNVYLPVSGKRAVPEVPVKERPVGGTETILVVDDETIITDVAEAILKNLGYQVIAVNDGASAVEAVKRIGGGIDLVLLDMIMPEMDGGRAFDRIREIQPRLPVILSSGYSINGQAAGIMKRGCNGFIQKPFNVSELDQKIREVLDRKQAPRQG